MTRCRPPVVEAQHLLRVLDEQAHLVGVLAAG
jgi:hypothetical protein